MKLSQDFLVDIPSASETAKNGIDSDIRMIGKCFCGEGKLTRFMVFVGLCRVFIV